jgi:hypothetical protein
MPIGSEKSAQVSTWALRGLRAALMVVSALAILLFLVAARQRLYFPYEYDWIENGMVACVRHIHGGLPLYAAPSINFTPFLYTPVYLYLASAMARVTGVSYVPLRLLSIFSTIGCLAVIYKLVYEETRQHFAALAAAGLFAACYATVYGTYDMGRVDMLYMFFVLCALYATRRMHPLFAALLWVCAFQTKQGVLPVALLMLCHTWRQPRRVLLGAGGFLAMLGVSIAWLSYATGGWYRYYVFGMTSGFGYNMQNALQYIPGDLRVCGIALILVLVALLLERPPDWRATIRNHPFSFYVLGTAGLVVFTGYIRAHRGANTNTLIPAYAWIAVLFGVALGRIHRRLAAQPETAARVVLAVVMLAAIVQIVQLRYSLDDAAPDSDDLAVRNQFEAVLQSIPGDVLVLSHPEDALMAGKTEYASSEAAGAVIDAHNSRKGQQNGDKLMAEYAALIHSGRLSAIVLDWPVEQYLAISRVWAPKDFLAYYPLRVSAVGGDERRFTSQPKWIYLPCPAAGAVDEARMLDANVDESACVKR